MDEKSEMVVLNAGGGYHVLCPLTNKGGIFVIFRAFGNCLCPVGTVVQKGDSLWQGMCEIIKFDKVADTTSLKGIFTENYASAISGVIEMVKEFFGEGEENGE